MLSLSDFAQTPPSTNREASSAAAIGPWALADLTAGKYRPNQISNDGTSAENTSSPICALIPQYIVEVCRLPYGASNSDAEVEAKI